MENYEIKNEEYFEKGEKTIIYFCTLNNGMEVVGYACNRNKEIAKQKAKERAEKSIRYFKDTPQKRNDINAK